jgi:hypothetical protein
MEHFPATEKDAGSTPARGSIFKNKYECAFLVLAGKSRDVYFDRTIASVSHQKAKFYGNLTWGEYEKLYYDTIRRFLGR